MSITRSVTQCHSDLEEEEGEGGMAHTERVFVVVVVFLTLLLFPANIQNKNRAAEKCIFHS